MSSEKEKFEINSQKLVEASGGSLRHADGGFEVFDSSTGKSYGIFENYGDAVEVAKKNKISAMGTWGDDEIPIGLWGTGTTRKDIREKEDSTHEADPTFGTGHF